jgi:hypothetical protein
MADDMQGEEHIPARFVGLDTESLRLKGRKRGRNGLLLMDVRCRACGRFLGRQGVLMGEIEFRCKCKQITSLTFERVGEQDLRAHQTGQDPYAPVLPEGHRIVDNTRPK